MKHEIEEIRKAVDAWYDGNATEQQESMLSGYFSSTEMDDIPEDLHTVALLMAGFRGMAGDRMPGQTLIVRRHSKRIFWFSVAAASAALLLVCGLLTGRTVYGYDYDGRTITDRQQALASTECLDCLRLLDDNMEYLDELFN